MNESKGFIPNCFGKEWDAADSVCREECAKFRECGHETTKKKMADGAEERSNGVIAAADLIRKKVETEVRSSYARPYTPAAQIAPPQPVYVQPPPVQHVQAPPPQQPQYAYPQQYAGPPVYQQMYAPQPQYMPAGYAIPNPVTVGESLEGGFLQALLGTVLRGGIKGVAHGIAHVADAYPLHLRKRRSQ